MTPQQMIASYRRYREHGLEFATACHGVCGPFEPTANRPNTTRWKALQVERTSVDDKREQVDIDLASGRQRGRYHRI
ncbi:hypothetical protein [Halosimplex amylolyticum]|uniref:hypothetical protein n=1 Tax=Halosimplex amylolyticum TaxID=3396616 RepID=UPI003F57D200